MRRMLRNTFVFIIPALIFVSCTKTAGDFAFKGFFDDTYRKIAGTPEFPSDREIKWVFAFSAAQGAKAIGVVYLKKELVWVEIMTESEGIEPGHSIVYGTIKGLRPGKYQIVLTDPAEDNREIARKDFVIYTPGDDDG
jgi:hypothetical protein